MRAGVRTAPPQRRGAQALPPEIEEYRDERWCREATRHVDTAAAAEQFIEQVGFAACLTDSRQPGPSLSLTSPATQTGEHEPPRFGKDDGQEYSNRYEAEPPIPATGMPLMLISTCRP